MKDEENIKEYINIENYIDMDRFIDKYYGYVYMVVKNLKGINISDEDVEEIVSDVFLAIWKNSDKLKSERVNIKAYLVGIIKNIFKNRLRNKYKEKVDYLNSNYEDIIADTIDIHEIIEEKDKDRIIKNTLMEFKKQDYEIFTMFYYASQKIKDIARTLHISESKVKVILHRMRTKIKKNLKRSGYDYE